MESSDFDNTTALAGRILPSIDLLTISRDEVIEIWKNVEFIANWQDVFLILFVGWALLPIVRICYLLSGKLVFHQSRTYFLVNTLQQMSRIALVVYGVDVLCIVLTILGFEFFRERNISRTFAKVVYSLWLAARIHDYKRDFLKKYVGELQDKRGLAKLLNHICNGFIAGLTAFFLIDILDVELGFTLKSAFAVGSAGTVAITLASQNLMTQLVDGLALTTSTNIYEGEIVTFGDGTGGTVLKLGWMKTVIRGSNDHVITVPNSHLAMQKVHNLSRERLCQVYQELRFHYKDADKLPELIEDMKEEIKSNCPDVITDGTRQFRIVWTDFNDDHLQVMVDVHFRLPAVGDLYWDNRQVVMQCIHRTVKKHNVEFAVRKYALAPNK